MYPMYILKATKFGSHQLNADVTVGNAVVIEILLTFILVLVILRTAADSHGHVSQRWGWCVGYLCSFPGTTSRTLPLCALGWR